MAGKSPRAKINMNAFLCLYKFLVRGTCVPLGVPTGATFVQSRCTEENANYFKDVCTLKCLPGYEATNPANTELKCGADSLWEGTVLRCERKYFAT